MKSKKFMMMIVAAVAAMVCVAKETRAMGLDGADVRGKRNVV